MEFCCASNAVLKNVKIARKKINFFVKLFFLNLYFPKCTDLKKITYIFGFCQFFPSF